jgi:hypothetical protein
MTASTDPDLVDAHPSVRETSAGAGRALLRDPGLFLISFAYHGIEAS